MAARAHFCFLPASQRSMDLRRLTCKVQARAYAVVFSANRERFSYDDASWG